MSSGGTQKADCCEEHRDKQERERGEIGETLRLRCRPTEGVCILKQELMSRGISSIHGFCTFCKERGA